jgi:hypothetical protein
VASGAIEIVRCSYTDDTVLSRGTYLTFISRFRSRIRVLSIFARSGKFGSHSTEEALWTKIFSIVGLRSASETVIACSTSISAVKLAVLTEVPSGT